MSLRNLFPNIAHARASLPLTAPKTQCNPFPRFRSIHSVPSRGPIAISIPRAAPGANAAKSRLSLYSLGLGLTFLSYNSLRKPVLCEVATPRPVVHHTGPPPQSMVDFYQLGFGTVCGICTGVFLKKGLRAIAFLLGGVFVLLQYMSSKSFVSVDWKKLASSYDSTFGTKTSEGVINQPTIKGAGNWIVDFVTANFQQRASFLAGLVLGVRLG